jgi:hypothetical protein
MQWRMLPAATAVRISATFIDGTSVSNVLMPLNGTSVALPVKP